MSVVLYRATLFRVTICGGPYPHERHDEKIAEGRVVLSAKSAGQCLRKYVWPRSMVAFLKKKEGHHAGKAPRTNARRVLSRNSRAF